MSGRQCLSGKVRSITNPCIHVRTCTYLQIRVLIRLVAAATIQERRLFRSALAQVRLLFDSGVYSREASIQSYTVCVAAVDCLMKCIISAHIHFLHVKPIFTTTTGMCATVLTTCTYICKRTSHGPLYCLVNNFFLSTHLQLLFMHNLYTCTSIIHDRALFSVQVYAVACTCTCVHTTVYGMVTVAACVCVL